MDKPRAFVLVSLVRGGEWQNMGVQPQLLISESPLPSQVQVRLHIVPFYPFQPLQLHFFMLHCLLLGNEGVIISLALRLQVLK